MKLTPFIVEYASKALIGGKLFDDALRIVAALQSRDLTGPQKREAAIGQLKIIGQDVAGFLINLAVELAVAWLKSKGR